MIEELRNPAWVPRVFPWGEHVLIWARPLTRKWSDYDGTNGISDHRTATEWRPCMLFGQEYGQRLNVIGSQYAYDPAEFEYGPDIAQPSGPA